MRLLDLAGALGAENFKAATPDMVFGPNLTENLFEVVKILCQGIGAKQKIVQALLAIIQLCDHQGINLEWHVRAKIAFNATRGYKHGKEY